MKEHFSLISNKNLNVEWASNAIALLVITSYLIQFFNRVLRSYFPYRVLILLSLVILVFSCRKLLVTSKLTVEKIWLLFPLVVCGSMISHDLTASYLMDLMTYLIGVFFIAFLGEDTKVYKKVVKIILFFSAMYAFSIYIQLLMPSIYKIYLSLLPSDSVEKINKFKQVYGMYTGFSTNPGFTAGHIVSGILMLFAHKVTNRVQNKLWFNITFIILIIALLMTGKRGHLLACFCACLFSYLYCVYGKKRFIFVNIFMMGVLIIIPVLMASADILSGIPSLGRIAESLNSIVAGADVSNGRSSLYIYAWQLFRENPLFGIGWGRYRLNVVGNITFMTELDAHNIYLQLLAETGVIGLLSFILPAIISLHKNVNNLKNLMLNGDKTSFQKMISVFALSYMVFFLLYGISGNPLYDYNYTILFFVAISMGATSIRELNYIFMSRERKI